MPAYVLKALMGIYGWMDGWMDGMKDGSLLGGIWEYEGVMGMGRNEIGESVN